MAEGCGAQEVLEAALQMPERNSKAHHDAIQKRRALGGEHGIDHVFSAYDVDAVVVASEM